MASIVPYRDGFRAYVGSGKTRRTKTHRLKSVVEAWAAEQEKIGDATRVTFAQAAERFLKLKLPKLDSKSNQRVYEQSIREHVLPVIGKLYLGDLDRQALVGLVRGIAKQGKVETAHRVGQRVRAILDHCIDEGDIKLHAAAGLSRVLPEKRTRNMPAVTERELPALLRAIDSYAEPVTRRGLWLLAHTMTRTSELIGARWDEIRDDVWVIPGERMKRKKNGKGVPHVVPLSPRVRAILTELEPMTGDSPYWLASPINPNVPISNNTLLFALYRLGYKGRMTGHGFRSVASTILNESGLWSRDAIERQLAHKETDRVREAYHRAEYLDERRRIMVWYSDYLAAKASSTTE
jgi:integrase